jgi:leader peptidase (prepilin peptidase)/N-methyltransferase
MNVPSLLAAIAFVPGLAIGSFLNVVAARVPDRRSIVRPRSACGECSREIAWYDNIPLLSYALLRGRCRHCASRIGIVYPAVEATAAILIAGCFARFGLTLTALVESVFCATLVTVSVTDLQRRVIPNRIVLPATGVALVGMTAAQPSPQWVIAAAAASAFLLAFALAVPGGMGMGDVKLALLIGAGLGRVTPVGMMIGLLAGLVPSLVLVARHGRRARKMTIPFGPALAFGAVVALFAGHAILGWYWAFNG